METTSSGLKTTRVCTLLITYSCNLHCVYCFEKYKSNDPSKRMSFETAKQILTKEFADFKRTGNKGRIAIDLFGGEPLTYFSIIKDIYAWVTSLDSPPPYIFQVTTNGTLFTDEIKEWFLERKNDFRVVMSVDGSEAMQMHNRGCSIHDLSMAFVKETWPDSYFKMTVSSHTLANYADGIIYLSENGYKIASTLAEGAKWKAGDDVIYKEELEKIARYYMEHPDKEPEYPFTFLFKEYLDDRIGKLPEKNCGVGTNVIVYDIDGKAYPCHLFLPIVHGKSIEVDALDFEDSHLIDDDCKDCQALKICRTCYGYNYKDRGDISKRDKNMCRLKLVEAKVVSAFQIKYLMDKKDTLNADELLRLKAAMRCYNDLKNFFL